MMSRLVWMTYLRPIFERIIKQMHDTMFEENFGKQQYVPQQIMIVKASRMLSGIMESKEHLPLLPAEIYLQTH